MNLIHLKERVAISTDFTPSERDFILEAINATPAWQIADGRGVAHDPGNYMGRIDSIWAFLSLDDGGEGVCAAPIGMQSLPLIAADKTRLDQLRPIVVQMAQRFKRPIRLAKFTKREDVEIIRP